MHESFAEPVCFSIVFERLIFGLVEWFLNNFGSTCGYQYILRLSIHVIIRQQVQARQNLLQKVQSDWLELANIKMHSE